MLIIRLSFLYFFQSQNHGTVNSITVVLLLFLLTISHSLSCSSKSTTVVKPPLMGRALASASSLWITPPFLPLSHRTSRANTICQKRQLKDFENSDTRLLFIMYPTNQIACENIEFQSTDLNYPSIYIHISYVCILSRNTVPNKNPIQSSTYMSISVNCICTSSVYSHGISPTVRYTTKLSTWQTTSAPLVARIVGSVTNTYAKYVEEAFMRLLDLTDLIVGKRVYSAVARLKGGLILTQVERRPG